MNSGNSFMTAIIVALDTGYLKGKGDGSSGAECL
jgi:hypothetical protein